MAFPQIDPVIFEIGPLAVRWYSLAYVVGLLGGIYYAIWLSKQKQLWGQIIPPNEESLNNFLLWAVLGVILGARLGYVLFYEPEYYFNNPSQIFAVWKGGMSFHGGLLGAVVVVILFCKKNSLNILNFGDLMAAMSPIGLFFGRFANFINGELWGRKTDVPWAVVFPSGGPSPRHPSQIYEALLEGLALFIMLQIAIFYFKKFQKPGQVLGLFLMGYGAARIFSEFFRNPDGYIIGDLTIGQGLSLPMIIIGAFLYVRAVK